MMERRMPCSAQNFIAAFSMTVLVADVYFFPPLRYDDGHWYIKIGHSPFDPLIADLE